MPSPAAASATVVVYNRCAAARIAPCYRPLVQEAVRAYQDVLAEHLVTIRLLGSVPRGHAVAGQSDIDFKALVAGPVPAPALERLAHRAAALHRAYPVVSRVDLDKQPRDELSAFQRFVLATDSLPLYGVDTLTQHRQVLQRTHLAALVTPPARPLIQSYRAAVVALDAPRDADTVRFYSRLTGKDLLKCLRGVVLQRGGAYERRIERIYTQVGRYAPEHQSLASALFQVYRASPADPEAVLVVLAAAEAALPQDEDFYTPA